MAENKNINKKERGHWGSRLGFIMAAAGSAVGLGNMWKFPYITYENHGGAFVMVYLVSILLVGFPIMVAEFIIGKKAKKNPVGAFQSLTKGSKSSPFWSFAGWLGLIAGFIILSYYSVVAGWTLDYTYRALTGEFHNVCENSKKEVEIVFNSNNKEKILSFCSKKLGEDNKLVKKYKKTPDLLNSAKLKELKNILINKIAGNKMGSIFGGLLGSSKRQLFWHFVFMFLTIIIVLGGVSGGIEKSTKILMPLLLIILVVLLKTSITTGGFSKAIHFLFSWKFSTLTPSSILEALGHAFFTLSLGMGAMLTYGSYLDDESDLLKSAFMITLFDTLIAFMACLVLFPIIFHFNLHPKASIGILFTTMPVVFNQLVGGKIFSVLFFSLLAFAALTSAISLLEVVVAYGVDELKMSRIPSTIFMGFLIFLMGVPSALCNGANKTISKIHIFTKGGVPLNWLDSFDYLASNWLLPLGGLFIALFVGWYLTDEDRLGQLVGLDKNSLVYKYIYLSLRYVSPVLVGVIMLNKIGVLSF